jgi:hypothetical protein
MPLATTMRRVAWRQHPLSVLYSLEGRTYCDHNPPPKAIDPDRLTGLLTRLPRVEHATSVVRACRLYALALELIHDRPEIAYQMLISSVEAIANSVLRTFQPEDDMKVEHKKSVYDLAITLRLGEEAATKLAVEACQGDFWATRKFKKFLIDNVGDSIWIEQDELFHQVSTEVLPKRDDFEKILGRIYSARSKATHEGDAYPVSALYTGGPTIEARAASLLYGADGAFPPVVWFERVVQSALVGFCERSLATLSN